MRIVRPTQNQREQPPARTSSKEGGINKEGDFMEKRGGGTYKGKPQNENMQFLNIFRHVLH